MAKYGRSASKSVKSAMHRKKKGTLKSGSGRTVKSRKQAIAIGLSEAREKGAKVPRKAPAPRSVPPRSADLAGNGPAFRRRIRWRDEQTRFARPFTGHCPWPSSPASVSLAAQWPKFRDRVDSAHRAGGINYDAPAPRTADGKIDFTGMWMRANSGPPGRGRGRGAAGAAGQAGARRAAAGRALKARRVRPARRRHPGRAADAKAWAPGAAAAACRSSRRRRRSRSTRPVRRSPRSSKPAATSRAACRTRRGRRRSGSSASRWTRPRTTPTPIACRWASCSSTSSRSRGRSFRRRELILIEYEANYGLRHIYLDGRKLPPQGDPQPWWYGYSVGHWEGDTLVVETNNLRGAEDGPLRRLAGRQRQPLQPAGEVHRALPAARPSAT